jgi:hypothetical protein
MLYSISPLIFIIYFIYFIYYNNIFDLLYIFSVYNNSLTIIHNVSFFIYEIINVFTSDNYEHLCLSEKIISSIFASIYIIIYISFRFGIILINFALYSYCFLYIALPINILIFILKIINKLIRETFAETFRYFILNDEDGIYIYEDIISDTLNSYIIIVLITINIIINIIYKIKSMLVIIFNCSKYIILIVFNGIRNIININNIIEQNKNLLYINKTQNKIINDLEIMHYSPKLLEIRQNIINALKLQIEDKNKIINDLTIKNNEVNKCTICIDNIISYCCIPCGHTYCSDCINKTNNCYICRGIIRNKIKLFL